MTSEPEEVRDLRLARNEALFREVNERIEQVTGRFGNPAPLNIVCECADGSCSRLIEVTHERYEALRSDPTHFAVAPEHNDPKVEVIVESHDAYIVVEKVGVAARVATATDPRRSAD